MLERGAEEGQPSPLEELRKAGYYDATFCFMLEKRPTSI